METRPSTDTTLHYDVTGAATGPALVLVHGLGCSRRDFDGLTPLLPAHLRVVAVDLAEHGDSRSTRADYSIGAFAADVVAVLDAAGIDRAILVGHSLGGAVAVELARVRPERVEAVIGLDALHFLGIYPLQPPEVVEQTVAFFAQDYVEAVRSLVDTGVVPETDPNVKAAAFAQMSSVRQPAGLTGLRGLLEWDMETALATTTQPITVIAARPLYDEDAHRRFGDRVDFRPEDLGSHFFPVEFPDQTARLILDALARIGGRVT
ncbi:alpha/beta hydrolase [Pseudonocardia kujensis]|uniref:alpha/beta fold hydrolase n=1 Tax=Pseudonocardia kujensis TaxID=1128675 RepID=UPI001E594BBB|nr:alpha/beta hydrolase [Pseudonocardia kujensis]MCE0763233.1 alpha/beta hydrolase [Pseudonocardia kujensis]